MDKRLIVTLIAVVAIVTVALAYVFVNLSSPQVTLRVDAQVVEKTVGQDFTVNISISNVAGLFAWDCRFKWNATMLEAVNVTEGPFLKSVNSTFFESTMNNTAGEIMIISTLQENVPGVSGGGVLATVKFHVKVTGTCGLDLADTMLVSYSEQQIPHVVADGTFKTP